jgi:hypothetical protein
MKSKNNNLFYWASFYCGFVAIVIFGVVARVAIGKEAIINAFLESIYYLLTQPIVTLLLIAPFVIVAYCSQSEYKEDKWVSGWILFICGIIPLEYLYFQGNMQSQYLLEQKKWTAATLSVGFLPFQSFPVLAVSLLIGWAISKIVYSKT